MAQKKKHTQAADTSTDETVAEDTVIGIESDPAEAGQSGDLQGLSGVASSDSESVRELMEEGQSFEAGIVSGIEDAPPAEDGPIRTKETPQDDVPLEYLERNRDEPKD